jgi:hypothetical protein
VEDELKEDIMGGIEASEDVNRVVYIWQERTRSWTGAVAVVMLQKG